VYAWLFDLFDRLHKGSLTSSPLHFNNAEENPKLLSLRLLRGDAYV
jgi:hypothetical protein